MEDITVRLPEISKDTESSAIVIKVTNHACLFLALQSSCLSHGGFLTITVNSTNKGMLSFQFLI